MKIAVTAPESVPFHLKILNSAHVRSEVIPFQVWILNQFIGHKQYFLIT